MNRLKYILYGTIGFISTSSIAAAGGGLASTSLGRNANGGVGSTSANAVGNLSAIWDRIMTSYGWLIWGIALIWAAYEFMFGDQKKAWRPLAGAAFLYLMGFIIGMSNKVVS